MDVRCVQVGTGSIPIAQTVLALDETSQAVYHSFSLDAFRLCTQHIKVYHDGRGHVLHEGNVLGRKPLSRLVVYDTVGTDLITIGRDDGNSSVEPPSAVCRICFITESLVFGQVRHNEDGIVRGLSDMVGGEVNGVLADGPSLRDGCNTIVNVVARSVVGFNLQTERLGGFCKDVLVIAIEEGNDGAFAVQSQGSELCESRQGSVGRCTRSSWSRLVLVRVNLCQAESDGLIVPGQQRLATR